MKLFFRINILIISILLLLSNCGQSEKNNKIQKNNKLQIDEFLPTNSEIAKIEKYDSKSRKILYEGLAILAEDIDNDKINEIIAACTTKKEDIDYSFIIVIGQKDEKYFKKWQSPFREGNLWYQDFTTVGFQIKNLNNDSYPEIILITGVGASIGACLDIFQWQDNKCVNISPVTNISYWGFYFKDIDNDGKEEILLYDKDSKGELNKNPIVYKWNGNQYIKK